MSLCLSIELISEDLLLPEVSHVVSFDIDSSYWKINKQINFNAISCQVCTGVFL